jgi:hypothetical protein
MRRTGSACIARYRYRRTRWSDAAAGANSAPRLTAPARPRISLIVFRAVTRVGACLQDRPLRRAAPVITDFARVSPRAGRLFRYLRIPDHAPDRQPTASRRRISVRAAFCEFYHLCCSLQLSRLEARELADSATATAAMVSNYYFTVGTEYFSPRSEILLLLHTWSLGVVTQL